MPTTGSVVLPFVVTVKPKLVEAPAAGVPFQAGLTVSTSPEVAGVPFHVAVRVYVAVQEPVPPSPPPLGEVRESTRSVRPRVSAVLVGPVPDASREIELGHDRDMRMPHVESFGPLRIREYAQRLRTAP